MGNMEAVHPVVLSTALGRLEDLTTVQISPIREDASFKAAVSFLDNAY